MKILDAVILLLFVVNAQKELSEEERNASQSSDYYYEDKKKYLTADLAISGNDDDMFGNGACSLTQTKPPLTVAWWMFTFPVDTVFITNVKINYRFNTLSRFAGYSLYVSNSSTSKTDGYRCYHHKGPGLPTANQSVKCNHLGKYVIIYNERKRTATYPAGWYTELAILELCKVRIHGCYKGWWDSDCSEPCPATCVDGHCLPGNGSCVWGCNPDNCLNDICNTVTGKCTQGCNMGRRGDYCDRPCESGTFGNNCFYKCHCGRQPCDPINGTCPDGGCQRGYKGTTCSTECSLGNYGYNCNQSCDGCLSDSCDNEDGVCTSKIGCKPGRQHVDQWKCEIVCASGTFGNNCLGKCHCLNQACYPEDGMCPAGGCQRGYEGSTCSTDCNNGTFGDGCLLQCYCQSGFCDKISGICPDKLCQPGWIGNSCSEACDDGYFGDDCATQCYCESVVCNKATGKCPHERCQRGWMGATCSEECSAGYHGFDCVDRCGTCNNTLCERFEGNCTHGCIEGFKGHQCLVSVTPQSDGQTTKDNTCTMNIIYAVIGTFMLTTLVCVIIFLAILRYILGKTDGDAMKQNRKTSREYANSTFTNDYANIGNNSTETHYEETISSAQEHPYDTI